MFGLDPAQMLNIMAYGVLAFVLLPIGLSRLIDSLFYGESNYFPPRVEVLYELMWAAVVLLIAITDLITGEVDWVFLVLTAIILVMTPFVVRKSLADIKAEKAECAEYHYHEEKALRYLSARFPGETIHIPWEAAIEKWYFGGYTQFVDNYPYEPKK